MASLNDFSKRIRIRARRVTEGADRLVRKVAIAADQAVVSATPVDTGRARSNWIVAMNSPASQVIRAYAPGKSGDSAQKNEAAAVAQGQAVISGYKSGNEIHITNNLAYIGELNDGSSRQAPANFVEESILEAARVVQSTLIVDGGKR